MTILWIALFENKGYKLLEDFMKASFQSIFRQFIIYHLYKTHIHS